MNKGIIFDYEQVLLGKRTHILSTYFCYTSKRNEELAVEILKYAFETYLRWSPEEIRDCLTWDIMKQLCLEQVAKYILFPAELNEETDLYYFAWRVYPWTMRISKTDLILNVYRNVLGQKLSRYPKEFFSGMYGIVRAHVCLKYMIGEYLTFASVEEMYAYFASGKGNAALRKYKLQKVCSDLYRSPLEYLHAALSDRQKSEYLYHYNVFAQERKRRMKECGQENEGQLQP